MAKAYGQITAAVVADQRSTGKKAVAALRKEGIEVLNLPHRGEPLIATLETSVVDVVVHVCPPSVPATRRAISGLRREVTGCPLIAVVPATGHRLGRAALDAKADAVLYEEQVAASIAPTIEAVRSGLVVLPRDEYRRSVPVVLSRRERDVLRLVAEGMGNDAIARALYLSRGTVKSHLTSAFAKLSVSSRSEAAAVLSDPEEPASRLVFSPSADGAEAVGSEP
jgi:DNA-binding NarL/FixJ family response regulator